MNETQKERLRSLIEACQEGDNFNYDFFFAGIEVEFREVAAAQESAFKERVIEALYEEKAKLNGYVIPAENLALMRGIDLALTRIERLSQ